MPATPGSQEETKAQLDKFKKSMTPKEYSRSKKVNKLVNILKTFDTGKFDTEAGGGLPAQIQRGIEDPTPEAPGAGAGVAAVSGAPTAGTGFAQTGAQSGVNLQQIFDEASKTPEILNLQSELETKKTALTTALTNINDNPFYSEATRTGRIAKLNEQAQREIGDLEDALNTRKADAQVKVNIAMKQYDIDDKNYQRNISRLNLLISSGALLNATSQDVASVATSTGLSTDMVRGIQTKMKMDMVQPQVITSTDDAGNVNIAVVDGATGDVISQNSLGAIGKSKAQPKADAVESLKPQMTSMLQSKANEPGFISPEDWSTNFRAWLAEGGDQKDFMNLFNIYVDTSRSADYFGFDDFFKIGD